MQRRPLNLLAVLAVAAAVTIGLATTGGGRDELSPLTAAQVRSGIADARPREAPVPPPIAAVQAQANRLLTGGSPALRARLAELRGTPVVVNVWGAWCDPCRREFPFFQRAAVSHAKRVAFLGVDTTDPADDARRFLRENPVPYPSYQDLKGRMADDLGLVGTPATIFYDARGRSRVKAGEYTSLADLDRDIRRFALDA